MASYNALYDEQHVCITRIGVYFFMYFKSEPDTEHISVIYIDQEFILAIDMLLICCT